MVSAEPRKNAQKWEPHQWVQAVMVVEGVTEAVTVVVTTILIAEMRAVKGAVAS